MGYAKFVSGAFGIGLFAIVACGDSTTSTPLTADQACTSATQALCDKINSCLPLVISTQYGDTQTCVTRGKLSCIPDLGAPGTSQTPALLDACAKAVGGVSCGDINSNSPPDACKVKPGTVANGGACATNAQCVSTACIDTEKTGCGTCGARVAIGGACGGAGQGPCDYGSTCVASVCKKLVTAGSPCTSSAECAFGLLCKGNACATPDAAGAACTPGAGDTCDRAQGFYCHATKKQCLAVKQGSINGACGFDAGGEYTVCIGGAYCKTNGTALNGVCTKLVADGGACSGTDPCQGPAQCIANVCKIVDPTSCK